MFAYINYLKKYKKLEDLIILELIVKYKINIGGISMLRIEKKSINKIVIKTKNNKKIMITDKNIINRLKYFIKKNSIKKGEYVFYNSKKKYLLKTEKIIVLRDLKIISTNPECFSITKEKVFLVNHLEKLI